MFVLANKSVQSIFLIETHIKRINKFRKKKIMAKVLVFQLFIVVCAVSLAIAGPQLDPDNKSHRGFSDNLDRRFGGNRAYDNIARPVIHGTYHASRYVGNGRNPEEWARAKDQFSKFGTGQQHTDYLKAHRNGK